MRWHRFSSVGDFLGMGNRSVRPFSELDQGYAAKASLDPDKCNGCGMCFVSCRDAGYGAIEKSDGLVAIDAGRCEGCSLCLQVCPTGAISMVES